MGERATGSCLPTPPSAVVVFPLPEVSSAAELVTHAQPMVGVGDRAFWNEGRRVKSKDEEE